MSDVFIPLELGKFQMCCAPGCHGDAVGEHKKKINGGTVYMGYCSVRGHNKQVSVLCLQTEHLTHEMPHAFFQPEGATRKIKVSMFLGKPFEPKVETSSKKKSPQMVKSFQWVHNYQKWRDLKGTVVPIKILSDEEILSAIYRIRIANFKRMSKKLEWTQWVKNMVIAQMVEYPEGSLEVSQQIAHEKLEEFKSIAIARGLM